MGFATAEAETGCSPPTDDAALAAGVVQLDEHPGAVLVHRVHEPPEPLHVADVSRGELAGFARARAVHDSA